jgi:phosphoribosylanthranilate isomerase
MFVKICGITRIEDAEAAVAAGADALGFVFWPESPRFIDAYRARTIVSSLPPFVTPVGVFVNQPIEHVREIANLVRLGAVQLHGDESPSYAGDVPRPILKAMSLEAATAAGELDRWPKQVTLLLDVHDPVRRGGTGRTLDWAAAASVAARRRSILAGGLRPENVADAIRRVRPFGIDVSSGVESSPGVKDRARLSALFEVLHAINHDPARS